MLTQVDSLRSNLAKNAIITLREMCKQLSPLLQNDLEIIVLKLLKRAADTNLFIAEESRKALDEVCQTFDEGKIVEVLLGFNSTKTSSVKISICNCLKTLVSNSEGNFKRIRNYGQLVAMVLGYILDSSQEVRYAARIAIAATAKHSLEIDEIENILHSMGLSNASIDTVWTTINKDLSNPNTIPALSSLITKCI